MGAIQILDEKLIGQIAAGEVVERPASVVKELVENSLDAGATRIEISLGKELLNITVSDNGCGMSRQDAQLAFARHATSKVNILEDLSRISTLGFRGEALPSIAAVSKLEMVTRLAGNTEATRVALEGGRIIASEPAARAPGTTVSVRDLFFNMPARKKHLKSQATEFGLIHETVGRLTMARPDVAFVLARQGREVYRSSGSNRLLDVAAVVYGPHEARQLIPFDYSSPDCRIEGLAGPPSISRGSRRYQAIFVNNRWIRNYTLTRAMEEAYRTLVLTGRYPVVILDIRIDPALVDVNVHPTKQEVRILNESQLGTIITQAIKKALAGRNLIPVWSNTRPDPVPAYRQVSLPPARAFTNTIPDQEEKREELIAIQEMAAAQAREEDCVPYRPDFPPLQALAQLHPTYILARGDGGLYIIDQHAAHERVLFEQQMAVLTGASAASQLLAIPLTLELSPLQFAALSSQLALLTSLGFILESFGGDYLLRGTPAEFPATYAREILTELLDAPPDTQAAPDREKFATALAAAVACKKAVKANDHLELKAMQALLDQLSRAEAPYTCPHGRPTVIHLSERELLTRFKRIP